LVNFSKSKRRWRLEFNLLKFDESGKRIPQITPEESKIQIQKNRLEYNAEIHAKNVIHKIAEALAVVTIEKGADALKPIQSKISPKFQKEIDQKVFAIRLGIKGGWLKINHKQIGQNLKKIMDLYLEAKAI